MTTKTKKLSLLGASFLTAAASFSFAAPALAQDPPAAEEATDEETVVVTGSRLRRDPVNAPTPLIQVQREAMIESGEANIVDYLADIPALQQSIVPEDTTGAGLGDGGLSLLNLRNLGSVRTLTLVDGRRHVGAGQGAPQVDVDTIPRLLIDNVEVVTGGASAIYGADAVGGVVNFILRRDFEGLEVDAVYAEINQDGQSNSRLSALWGAGGLNDRLHVYLTGEYEASDEVLDSDIDWQRDDCALLNNDSDAAAVPSDGDTDNIILCGLRSYSRPFGGILTLAHGTPGSDTDDPDIPNAACSISGGSAASLGTNCFLIDPPYSYQFQPDGTPYLVDYGSFRDQNGALRTTSVGGSGDPLWRFGDSRLPEAESFRFQAGANYDILPNIELFAEVKAVHETTLDNFQPAFFDLQVIGTSTVNPAQNYFTYGNPDFHTYDNGQAEIWSLNQFVMNLEGNPFFDPALAALIRANVRTCYANATSAGPGAVTTCPGGGGTTTVDPRAMIRVFTDDLGSRPQDNSRDLYRFVVGARGDLNQVFFLNNFAWEVGFTRGETSDENVEFETIDVERFMYSIDAVTDTLGEVNGIPGETVCRVQLLAAQGTFLVDQALGVIMDPNDDRVTECVPSSIFGSGGLSPAYDYIVTSQRLTNNDRQQDFLAFASADLWDLWGAGTIGIAGGYEWREETFSGRQFRDNDRVLFSNFISDFPEASFNVHDFFAEVNVPLISGQPFAEAVDFTAAYRISDYSTGAESDTYSLTGTWRVSQDLMFTGTYGFSVRAPSLGELYSANSDTFLQLTDNCSAPVILASSGTLQANRIANCEAVWPGLVSGGYVDPQPTTTNFGQSGGNANLLPEESVSWTGSISITPRFLPNMAFRIDYYDIEIENVIAALTLQQIMNNCVDNDSPNFTACSLLTRTDADFDGVYEFPTDGEVEFFQQGPVNYATFNAKGVDITARYFADLQEWTGQNWGSLDWSLTGSYQFQRENATDPLNPQNYTEIDSTIGNPHVRLLSRLTWNFDALSVTWEADWQSAQEILDDRDVVIDSDNRDSYLLDSGDFIQHDFFARYNINDNVALRAGVINAFDEEPSIQSRVADNFDLFGRRMFIGVNFRR